MGSMIMSTKFIGGSNIKKIHPLYNDFMMTLQDILHLYTSPYNLNFGKLEAPWQVLRIQAKK